MHKRIITNPLAIKQKEENLYESFLSLEVRNQTIRTLIKENYANLETKTHNDSYIYQNIISNEKQKVECAWGANI